MLEYTRELVTEYEYPNMLLYRKYENGKLCAYELEPVSGYLMYDASLMNNTQQEENEKPIYYCSFAGFPVEKDITNLTWIAVKQESIVDVIEDIILKDLSSSTQEKEDQKIVDINVFDNSYSIIYSNPDSESPRA